MAEPGPRLVSINELRFRPANSNARARAGMEHAFNDVPACSFAGDDGISPYLGADSGIRDFPDHPKAQSALHDDVPDVAHESGTPVVSLGAKLLRSGFAFSIWLHVIVFCGVGYYASVKLPDDALLEGETVLAVEFFSETDSEITLKQQQDKQDGEVEAVEEAREEPKVEPKEEDVRPVEQEKPVEQATLPEPVEKPVETSEKIEQPAIVSEQPEILSTTEPSSFQIEQAARQIIDETKIEPLPDAPPPMLVTPLQEEKPEPEKKLAQPLAHPVSKPRVVEKVAEVRPVEKKPEPKVVEPKTQEVEKPAPEAKKEVRKKKLARDGNADQDNTKGSSTAQNKDGASRDASQGNSKNRGKGNSSGTNYKGIVQRKLERAKKRGSAPGKGIVTVGFTINGDGSVSGLRIKKSSGKPALDKAALDVVRKASPFPAIPAEEGRSSWPMSVPMVFK